MHRNNRYQTASPTRMQQRRVRKPDYSNNNKNNNNYYYYRDKTIRTVGKANTFVPYNNDDTRRFITRKKTAPTYDEDEVDDEVAQYYDDRCYDDDYGGDDENRFGNTYYNEECSSNNYNSNDNVYADEHNDDGDNYCFGDENYGYDNNNDQGHVDANEGGIHEKYEREFFSNTIRKRRRKTLDSADGDGGKRDVRSRLGPRSPVEHEDNIIGVGYDDAFMGNPQVVYNHPSLQSSSRSQADGIKYPPENSRNNVERDSNEYKQDKNNNDLLKNDTITANGDFDKQITKAMLDEFGISITDIADYLRRQIAEKEKNGDLTLNQLLEEKFSSAKSTTQENTDDKIEFTSKVERERTISPSFTFGNESNSGQSNNVNESKTESSSRRHNADKGKSRMSSKSDRSSKEHSGKDHRSRSPTSATRSPTLEKRQLRPTEKDHGKNCKYNTVRIPDRRKKSSYSPGKKSHHDKPSCFERRKSSDEWKISKEVKRSSNLGRRLSTDKKRSIEAILINAGEQGVNEFKKQQASQFIANKLQKAHFQTLISQVTYPVSPLALPRHHLVSTPSINAPAATPVFISTKSPLVTSDFLPLETANDKVMANTHSNILKNDTKQEEAKVDTSLTRSSIDETLSLIRKSSSSVPLKTSDIDSSSSSSGVDDKEKINEDVGCETKNNEPGDRQNSSDEVSITHVVEPQKKKIVVKPVVTAIEPDDKPTKSTTTDSGRKVFFNKTTPKEENPITTINNNNNNSKEQQTNQRNRRVRVPSWFNARLVELFKKRHKKMQQLKRAKQNPSAAEENPNHLIELREAMREIDREYIPLCRKTKEEFVKNGGSNNGKSSRKKQEVAPAGFDDSKIFDVADP